MIRLLLPLFLLACSGGKPEDTGPADTGEADADTDTDSDTDADTDSDTDADTDSDTDADTDADTDSDTDTDTDTNTGEPDIVTLGVTDVALESVDPSTLRTMSATAEGGGSVAVIDVHVTDGCCPDPIVTATLDVATSTITPVYILMDDVCDCYTGLTLSYTLTGVPSGTYTIVEGTASVEVTVP